MSKITKKEKAVADRLRREISGSRPALSEELHARLCRAVLQQQADRSPLPVRRPNANRFFRWASLAAAACLLAAIGIAWQARHAVRDTRLDAPALASRPKAGLGNMAELAGRVAAKTDAMMDAAVKAQRWAALEQDARSVWEMPSVRLPFDVVSSLLSVPRKERTREPSPHTTIRFRNDAFRELAGVPQG
jgi:hypothetical protein